MTHGAITGIPVVVNDFACISKAWVQFRFPKSKKKRIRNKWACQARNYRTEEKHRAFKMGGKLIISSRMLKEFTEKKLNDQNETRHF